MKTSATAFAPASVSNVASGFDIMGFALEEPGDTVTVRRCDRPGVRIVAVKGDCTGLPIDPTLNTAGAPVIAMARDFGDATGIEIEITKGLPAGSGIGSSAASAVAAAVAANALFEAGLDQKEILTYAVEGEKIASGSVHVDNLAPSLMGGFVLVRGYDPVDVVGIPVPEGLWCTVICPKIVIHTKAAREILPKLVPLRDVVKQTGNAAGLVAGLLLGDFALVGRSLHDVIAEPVRAALVPGFQQMKSAARDAGALGASISGSGPAVFALSTSRSDADCIGNAMGGILDTLHVPFVTYVSRISRSGAHVVGQAP